MSKNWYPIIDEKTCSKCGKCIAFCKHGVYDKNESNKPVVINPEGCIDHCHGCGGLCPTGSITYVGEDTGWTPPHDKNASQSDSCACGDDRACGELSVEPEPQDGACSCGGDCSCGNETENEIPAKPLAIDFLYLDLNTCERCIATGDTLDEALTTLAPTFLALNYAAKVNKVNITTRESAEQYRFLSSPTIRVNGVDICEDVKESYCKDGDDLCGDKIDCRVFVYDGKDYEQPPAAMIIDGILRVLYGELVQAEPKVYKLPENLNKYFKGRDSIMQNSKTTTDCGCDTDCGCGGTAATAVQATKNLVIEWRHLDVDDETCDRCYDTGENLAAEVKRLNRALNPQGIEVKYNEVKLDETQIHESNVILFNGVPIEDILDIEVSENYCGSCSALVGKDVSCRSIKYDGNQYDDVPAKAIRQAVYTVLGLIDDTPSESGCCDSGSDCGCGDTQTNNNSRSDSAMKTLAIYEPALCCETGVCGVGVDPELIRISTVINNLKKRGITIKRYNLNSFPQEFIKSEAINKLINGDGGVDNLPATVLDGKIVKTRKYPVNAEMMIWLGIPESYFGAEAAKQSSCCGTGSESTSDCCGTASKSKSGGRCC